MIETIILNHLSSGGVTAYMEIPEGGGTPPFCVIERTGGGEENRIRHATVAIQSYGASLYLAAELNQTIIELMDGIADGGKVSSCRLNSDYNFTDTTKKKYRYQAVFDLVYYDQEDN